VHLLPGGHRPFVHYKSQPYAKRQKSTGYLSGWLDSRVVSVLDSGAVVARIQITAATLSGYSHRQTVLTSHASIHQAVKLVAALLRVARVTAGLAESNGSLPPGL